MGLGDLIGKSLVKSTVLTEYQADTKQMRFELNRMSKEEQKRHRALIKQTEEQNYAIDKMNKAAIAGDNARRESLAKVGLALATATGAAVVAYKALSKGLDTYRENAKLAAATEGVNIEGLRQATNGLVDDVRLLEFAAGAMNGTFRLTQGEMQDALQGALALRKGGKDLAETLDRIQQSVEQGTTEPLKELGIVIKGAENDTEEGLQAAIAGMREEVKKLGGDFEVAGDDISRAGVSMDNSMDRIMDSLGRLAVALTPAIEHFAGMVEVMTDISGERFRAEMASIAASAEETQRQISETFAKLERESPGNFFRDQMRMAEFDTLAEQGGGFGGVEAAPFRFLGEEFDTRKKKAVGGKSGPSASSISVSDWLKSQGGKGVDIAGAAGRLLGAGASALGGMQERVSERNKEQDEAIARVQKMTDAEIQLFETNEKLRAQAEAGSVLAGIFGTSTEMDANLAQLAVMTQGFNLFADAFGQSIDALITGGDLFSGGMKKFVAENLRTMAVEMGVYALRETAMGFMAAANPLTAATAPAHFAAAKVFGATALAAGVGANLLGAGQSQGAPSTAGTAGVGRASSVDHRGGASGGGDGRQTQVFFLDDDFTSLPARQRQAMFRTRARRSGVTVEGDAIING